MKLANIMLHTAKGTSENIELTDEFKNARAKLVGRIREKAKQGKVCIVVNSTDIEGKNFNLKGFLGVEGFTLIDRPQKRVIILWNC